MPEGRNGDQETNEASWLSLRRFLANWRRTFVHTSHWLHWVPEYPDQSWSLEICILALSGQGLSMSLRVIFQRKGLKNMHWDRRVDISAAAHSALLGWNWELQLHLICRCKFKVVNIGISDLCNLLSLYLPFSHLFLKCICAFSLKFISRRFTICLVVWSLLQFHHFSIWL